MQKEKKEYHTLCSECLNQIVSINDDIKVNKSEQIKIDDNHIYMIGKHGPVIKSTVNKKSEFISVKKDIDLEKLKKW